MTLRGPGVRTPRNVRPCIGGLDVGSPCCGPLAAPTAMAWPDTPRCQNAAQLGSDPATRPSHKTHPAELLSSSAHAPGRVHHSSPASSSPPPTSSPKPLSALRRPLTLPIRIRKSPSPAQSAPDSTSHSPTGTDASTPTHVAYIRYTSFSPLLNVSLFHYVAPHAPRSSHYAFHRLQFFRCHHILSLLPHHRHHHHHHHYPLDLLYNHEHQGPVNTTHRMLRHPHRSRRWQGPPNNQPETAK